MSNLQENDLRRWSSEYLNYLIHQKNVNKSQITFFDNGCPVFPLARCFPEILKFESSTPATRRQRSQPNLTDHLKISKQFSSKLN